MAVKVVMKALGYFALSSVQNTEKLPTQQMRQSTWKFKEKIFCVVWVSIIENLELRLGYTPRARIQLSIYEKSCDNCILILEVNSWKLSSQLSI